MLLPVARWIVNWWRDAAALLTGGSRPPKRLRLFLGRSPLAATATIRNEEMITERYHLAGTGPGPRDSSGEGGEQLAEGALSSSSSGGGPLPNITRNNACSPDYWNPEGRIGSSNPCTSAYWETPQERAPRLAGEQQVAPRTGRGTGSDADELRRVCEVRCSKLDGSARRCVFGLLLSYKE